jgi:hypothetical protein
VEEADMGGVMEQQRDEVLETEEDVDVAPRRKVVVTGSASALYGRHAVTVRGHIEVRAGANVILEGPTGKITVGARGRLEVGDEEQSEGAPASSWDATLRVGTPCSVSIGNGGRAAVRATGAIATASSTSIATAPYG